MRFLASVLTIINMIILLEGAVQNPITQSNPMPNAVQGTAPMPRDCSRFLPTKWLDTTLHHVQYFNDYTKEMAFCRRYGITVDNNTNLRLGDVRYVDCLKLLAPYFNKYRNEDPQNIERYANTCIDHDIGIVKCARTMLQLQDGCWLMENASEYISIAVEHILNNPDFNPDLSRADYLHYQPIRLDTCIDMFQKNKSETAWSVLGAYLKEITLNDLSKSVIPKKGCTCVEIILLDKIGQKYTTNNQLRKELWIKICHHITAHTWQRRQLESILQDIPDINLKLTMEFLTDQGIKIAQANWMEKDRLKDWSYSDIIKHTNESNTLNPIKVDLVVEAILNEINETELSDLTAVLELDPTVKITCLTKILQIMAKISITVHSEISLPKFWNRYYSVQGFHSHFQVVIAMFKNTKVVICSDKFFQDFEKLQQHLFSSPYDISIINDFTDQLRRNTSEITLTIDQIISCFDNFQKYETTIYQNMPQKDAALYKWTTENPDRYNFVRQQIIKHMVTSDDGGLKCIRDISTEKLPPIRVQ